MVSQAKQEVSQDLRFERKEKTLPSWPRTHRGKLMTVVTVGLVLALVAAVMVLRRPGEHENKQRKTVAGSVQEATVQVIPGAPAKLEVPGATLLVPAGAVRTPTTAHLRFVGLDLIQRLPAKARTAFRRVAPAIGVDLSGQQPAKPLLLTLALPPNTQIQSKNLVLLTEHAGRMGGIRGKYDPARHAFTAGLTQLSGFQLSVIDPVKLFNEAEQFIASLLDVTGVRGLKPKCFGQSVKLPDGSSVRIADLSASGVLWPCVSLAQGRVAVTVHSATASIWRVIASDGAEYQGSGVIDAASMVQQALFDVLVQDRKVNEGLILPQSEGTWSFSPDRLPGTMVAKLSEGMWFVEATAFSLTYLADVFSGGQFSNAVGAAQAFAGLDKLDCLKKAADVVADGVKINQETVDRLAKAAVTCTPVIWKAMHGVELGGLPKLILDILSSGITVVWGALVTAKRNFFSLWNEERWLSWRIVSSGSFEPFVETWTVHGLHLVIRADHSGTVDWNAGPCEDPFANPGGETSNCEGHANLVFDSVNGNELTGRVVGEVYFVSWKTQKRVPITDYLKQNSGLKTGQRVRLQRLSPGQLRSKELGNPYLCGDKATKSEIMNCGA